MFGFVALSQVQQVVPLLAPAVAALFAGYFLVRRGTVRSLNSGHVIIFLLIAYVLLNFVLHASEELTPDRIVGFVAGDGRFLYVLVFSAMCSIIAWRSDDAERLVRATVYVTTLIVAFSVFTYLVGPIRVGSLSLGTMRNSSGVHLSGLLGTKNPFAGSIGVVACAAAAVLLMRGEQSVRDRARLAVCCGIIVVGLILTGSRGYAIAAIAVAGYLALFEVKDQARAVQIRTASLLILVAASIGFVALNLERITSVAQGDDNIIRRFALFRHSIDIWSESLLIGLGPGSVQSLQLTYDTVVPRLVAVRTSAMILPEIYWANTDLPIGQHSHNVILQILVDYGLIGLVLVSLLFVKVARSSAALGYFDIGLLNRTLILYLLFSGMVAGFTFLSPSLSWLLWFSVAFWISRASSLPALAQGVTKWPGRSVVTAM